MSNFNFYQWFYLTEHLLPKLPLQINPRVIEYSTRLKNCIKSNGFVFPKTYETPQNNPLKPLVTIDRESGIDLKKTLLGSGLALEVTSDNDLVTHKFAEAWIQEALSAAPHGSLQPSVLVATASVSFSSRCQEVANAVSRSFPNPSSCRLPIQPNKPIQINPDPPSSLAAISMLKVTSIIYQDNDHIMNVINNVCNAYFNSSLSEYEEEEETEGEEAIFEYEGERNVTALDKESKNKMIESNLSLIVLDLTKTKEEDAFATELCNVGETGGEEGGSNRENGARNMQEAAEDMILITIEKILSAPFIRPLSYSPSSSPHQQSFSGPLIVILRSKRLEATTLGITAGNAVKFKSEFSSSSQIYVDIVLDLKSKGYGISTSSFASPPEISSLPSSFHSSLPFHPIPDPSTSPFSPNLSPRFDLKSIMINVGKKSLAWAMGRFTSHQKE
uniref:Uncharacterized protein n=1 Tax=Polytomella parva TaxID=51329 RepID=A0A7S0V9X3_9CHLO